MWLFIVASEDGLRVGIQGLRVTALVFDCVCDSADLFLNTFCELKRGLLHLF